LAGGLDPVVDGHGSVGDNELVGDGESVGDSELAAEIVPWLALSDPSTLPAED